MMKFLKKLWQKMNSPEGLKVADIMLKISLFINCCLSGYLLLVVVALVISKGFLGPLELGDVAFGIAALLYSVFTFRALWRDVFWDL